MGRYLKILTLLLSVLNIHWKDWCWNSNTLATWCEELTHLKRPWCWGRLKTWGEGDDRGWDGWMASPTQCTWVWVNSESWWWTGRPGMLQSMGSQSRAQLSDWTELNWTLLWTVLGGFSRMWGPEAWGCSPRITWKKMEPLLSPEEDAPIEGTMTKNLHRKRLGFGSQRNLGESRLCHS